MTHQERRSNCSVAQSLVVAILMFLCVGVACAAILDRVFEGFFELLAGYRFRTTGLIRDLCLGVWIGSSLLVAYLVSRKVYTRLRWGRDPASAWRYCLTCGYDLAGNESGHCPECGRRFDNYYRQERLRAKDELGRDEDAE
ncbi:MAG: hypothetical protein KDA33_14680 [Phycisphaerales bacterium]|nr:hypothetical protein [Phycisphaerales bacterium]